MCARRMKAPWRNLKAIVLLSLAAIPAWLYFEVVTGNSYTYPGWNTDPGSYFVMNSNILSIVSAASGDCMFINYYITNQSEIIFYVKTPNSGAHPFRRTRYGYRNPIDNEYLIKTSPTWRNLYSYFNYYTTDPMYRP